MHWDKKLMHLVCMPQALLCIEVLCHPVVIGHPARGQAASALNLRQKAAPALMILPAVTAVTAIVRNHGMALAVNKPLR